jgi:hypothetical protein
MSSLLWAGLVLVTSHSGTKVRIFGYLAILSNIIIPTYRIHFAEVIRKPVAWRARGFPYSG